MISGASSPRLCRRDFSSSQLGGKMKIRHRVGKQFFDLNGALEVDLQHHVGALGNAVFNGFARSAVALAMHMGPL